jgi:subtilase family serine protease
MRISLRWLLPALAAIVAAALVVVWLQASGGTTARLSASSQASERAVCGTVQPGQLHCLSIRNTGIRPLAAGPDVTPAGYGPADLRSAYNMPSATAGAGRTVAIVDAFDDPKAESDMNAYRSQYGLPACTSASGCFRKVGEDGSTKLPPHFITSGWSTEESLDLDMVSAICPGCKIILVEVSNLYPINFGRGVNSAVRLGAKYVSNSYGGPEFSGENSTYGKYYNHPGVAVTVSAGDSGYGVSWPAASRYVTSVGGTSLRKSSTSRGWTELVWNGTGSGCSRYSGKPSWQPARSGCPTHRTDNDVAAVADPAFGVAVYDTYDQGGWIEVGGTSASAPIIAAAYARSSVPRANTYPASYPYRHPSYFWDITSGYNGTCGTYLCGARKGFDGPTGLGTPHTSTGLKY